MFYIICYILFTLLLLIFNIKSRFKISKIISYKNEESLKIRNKEVLNPFISIIIYCITPHDIRNLINSINYDKNKYEIIVLYPKTYKLVKSNKISKKIIINNTNNVYHNLNLAFKYINNKSKYISIFDNNSLLVPNTIYDMIKLLQQHQLDSVYCLNNYQNYKANFINNVYYHYKYLDSQINQNIIFGQVLSSKVVKDFGKKKIKSIILKKNLIIQNLPLVKHIPNEIYRIELQNYRFDNFYLIELAFFMISITTSLFTFSIFIMNLWLYQYQESNINFGINDFDLLQSLYLLILKLISLPISLFHLITFNYFNSVYYHKIQSKNFIKPKLSEKIEYSYGYMYKLKNYNFELVYLKGSHYQMGITIGEIYKKEIHDSIKLLDTILPPFALNPLWKNYGYKAKNILQIIKQHCWKYISNQNKEELKGIAEGSKIELETIILLSLIPCLFKAHCTILIDQNIFLRTLDVDFKNKKGVLLVYNPDESNKYAAITAPGMNWCITGFSEKIAIGEVFNDYCKTSENKDGSPFMLNFKDILRSSNNLKDSLNIMKELEWNDSIDIAISDLNNENNYFIEKRGNTSIIFDNDNFNEYLDKYSKNNINNQKRYSFYYNLDLIYNIINQYDKLSINDAYYSIVMGLETGSNHTLIIDKASKKCYLSTASEEKEGYLREMIEFNIDDIFNGY